MVKITKTKNKKLNQRGMKEKWLNLIVRVTNHIYTAKKEITTRYGLKSVLGVLKLVLLEVILALLSLPLYLTTRAEKSTAYLETKGEYGAIATDYKLRKILTLTGVGVIFVIWTVKLLLIVLTPAVYGPLELYKVSDLRPLTIEERDIFVHEAGVQTAKLSTALEVPKILDIKKERGLKYSFRGEGIPGAQVVLFVTDQQSVMYSGKVDENGFWEIEHSQDNFKINQGVHSMFALHYDESTEMRSSASNEQYFRVDKSFFEDFTNNLDSFANWVLAILIVMGIFLTALTL